MRGAGDDTSSSVSPPSRIRNALQSVRSAEEGEEARADEPEADAEGSISRIALAPSQAEGRVERVDHGRAGADRDADRRRAPQNRARAEDPDRPHLGGDEESEPEAGRERVAHRASLRPPASARAAIRTLLNTSVPGTVPIDAPIL